MDFTYRIIMSIGQTLFKYQGAQFTFIGEENVPQDGPVLFVSNHIGLFDYVYTAYPYWKFAHRYSRFMAKKEIFDTKVAGFIMRRLKHIPVDRENGAASYEQAVEYLKRGEIVGVFAEGTTSSSFEVKAFKTGAARMSLETGVPVTPMAVWGTQRVFSFRHNRVLKRDHTPIIICIGEQIEPEGTVEELTVKYRDTVEKLLYEAQYQYEQPEGAWWLPHRLGGSAPTMAEAGELEALKKARRKAKQEERSTKHHKKR